MYLSWLILLVGAKVSFYSQHPEYLREGHRPLALNNALRERMALSIMAVVGRDFYEGRQRWTVNDLASFLGVPGRGVLPIAAQLEDAGLLVPTAEGKLVPGRAMDTIRVADILAAVRGQPASEPRYALPVQKPVGELLERLESAIDAAAAGETLKTLVEADCRQPDDQTPV